MTTIGKAYLKTDMQNEMLIKNENHKVESAFIINCSHKLPEVNPS